MKVAIAGSRRLPTGTAPRVLMHFLLALPQDAVVLLRVGRSTMAGPFEQDVKRLCQILGIATEWRVPEEHGGRASVYARDIELVNEADLTVLFLEESEAADGYSGTYHLFEKALDDQRPVYAWTVPSDSSPLRAERWGEYDPLHKFADLFA